MGKSKRNKHRRDSWLDDPVHRANAEVVAAERTLLAKRQAAARAAAAAVNGQQPQTPAEQAEAFFNRPGDYFVGRFNIGGHVDGGPSGVTFVAECVFKADEQQLPYLVEVIRQIRGGFGDRARIELSRARTQAGPPVGKRVEYGPGTAPAEAMQPDVTPSWPPPPPAWDPTAPVAPAPWADQPDTLEDLAADLLPSDGSDLTREQLQAQLPGMTRAEVADELGVHPADIGGEIKHAGDLELEQIAAEMGLSPLDLEPIEMRGGGRVYAVKPRQTQPPAGRHAAPDASTGDNKRGGDE